MQANKLRPGTVLNHEGHLWLCLESTHRTPGNKRAFVQAKMRNIKDGSQKDFKFGSTEALDQISLRTKEMQFVYSDDAFHFMDLQTYDQISINASMVGQAANYLLPETKVQITFHEETPIGLQLPQKMEFKVTQTDPGMKSATATASYKTAKIETGLNIQVPQFIQEGEKIVVSTETGDYVERAKG